MTEPCPDLASLAGADALPAAHPLRAHLQSCSRCRASLRALAAFRAGDGSADLPDRDLADADRRLAAFLEAHLPGAETVPAPPARRWPPRARSRAGWLAAAAVLVVAVGLWSLGPGPGGGPADDGGPLRGEAGEAARAVTVTRDRDGALQVAWPAAAGADAYEIVLWSADLAEIARHHTGPVTGSRVAAPATTPAPAYLTVVALQGGREIGRTALVTLP
ncbi:MAG: hypothetical protein R6X35_15935 [Candidatus Krumholzibacteriia bacterium]